MANPHLFSKMKLGSIQNKQAAQTVKKALEEDPTVFQYDEVYDDIERDRIEKKEKAKADRQPKYIHELMKSAERRQRENERRIEKQVQKDLEKEGDKYKDKEAFVTSAYKNKMEELKRLEEEQQRQDAIDELTDVTKQQDLSGFYRHLFRSTMESSEKQGNSSSDNNPAVVDPASETEHKRRTHIDEDEQSSGHSDNPEQKRKSIRRDSESHDYHRSGDKDRSSSHRHHYHHRDHKERSHSGERERDQYFRKDRESERYRDRGRDKRENREREDRHRMDYHRGDQEKRKHSASHREVNQRHHPYSRRDRYYHSKGREDRGRSRSPLSRRNPTKSSTHSSKVETLKENTRPKATKVKSDHGHASPTCQYDKLSDNPIWKKRTVGKLLADARDRYLERKNSGVIRALVVKER